MRDIQTLSLIPGPFRGEKGVKPLALRDKGTLAAEQRGWGEGVFCTYF